MGLGPFWEAFLVFSAHITVLHKTVLFVVSPKNVISNELNLTARIFKQFSQTINIRSVEARGILAVASWRPGRPLSPPYPPI